MITDQELYILSYYRACELAGSILFGKLAFHTELDTMRAPLTQHALEEAEHAWLWTDTIRKLGHVPLKVTEAYQTEYAKEFGLPKNLLEILALTQVFEKRTLLHFTLHAAMPGINPLIKAALEKMIEDESGHIGWVRTELDQYAEEHGSDEVESLMTRLTEIDEKVYSRLLSRPEFKNYFN